MIIVEVKMRTGLSSARRLADRRKSALAAIARREWLLQMLAFAAAGCTRGERRTARESKLIIPYYADCHA